HTQGIPEVGVVVRTLRDQVVAGIEPGVDEGLEEGDGDAIVAAAVEVRIDGRRRRQREHQGDDEAPAIGWERVARARGSVGHGRSMATKRRATKVASRAADQGFMRRMTARSWLAAACV